ncbi:MAG: pitrilysin family protein, partial [Thermodesulfobacteriota bacterium]
MGLGPVKRLFGLFAVILLLSLVAASSARAAGPLDFRLSNGLEVILIENHRAPVVSMLVWVKVGSASEREGEYGLAHLMEHMLFKGTEKRGPGEIARMVEDSGGAINAFTSYDQTVYYVDMAGRYFERGLEALADMVFHPAFDPEEFAREKEVVVEEIKQKEDLPDHRLVQDVFRRAYLVHPYGRPVIGFSESVRGVSRETALAFHGRWYQPANMVLVVCGDFDPSGLRGMVEKYFGEEKGGAAPEEGRPAEPSQQETRVSVLRSDVNTARIQLAWHIPGFRHQDIHAVDLLAEILGQGETSRLYRRLRREKELVTGVSAGAYTPQDPGLFTIAAELAPGKILPALEELAAEAALVGLAGVTSEELARARLNVQSYFIYSRTTMSGEARTAANFKALGGDLAAKDRYLADIERVTLEDVRRVAAEYLRRENLTVGLLLPEGAEPGLDEKAVLAAVTRGAALAAEGKPGPAAPAGFRKYKLDNGAVLLVKPDDSLPLVSLRAAFLGGLLLEPPELPGLANYLAAVWDKGTRDLSAEELARAVEDMAGDITAFSGRNSFGLTGDFLSRFLDHGLGLFAEVLTRPAFDPAEVEKVRPVILEAIKRRQDQTAAQAFLLFAKVLYQDHPYARDVLGTAESVGKMTAEDLRAYYEKHARPGDAVLAVVGDVDPDRIRDRLNRLTRDWTGRVIYPTPVPLPQPWQGLRKSDLPLSRNQTHLVLGFPAPGLASPDRYALDVLDRILSNQGGRLFIELRDKRGLAYSVSSFYNPGLGLGSFGLYIAFDPAKRTEVEAGFARIIQDLKDHPVTDRELAGAKENILGGYEIGL